MSDSATPLDLAPRMAFRSIDPQTSARLSLARDVLLAVLPRAVDGLYEHMAGWPPLMQMFRDESRRRYARDSQVRHWSLLLTGELGPEYAASVQRIGRTHSRIGLEPQWFLGAYTRITSDLQAACLEAWAPRISKDLRARAELEGVLRAIVQVTNLDMDLVVAVYLEDTQARHRSQLETLSTTFRSSFSSTLGKTASDVGAAAQQIRSSAAQTESQGARADAAAKAAHLAVQSIAAALEEVSRSVIEIRGQTERSTQITTDAVKKTRDIDRVMGTLADAVAQIDTGVAAINDIAERTNILAINASIEAARAGSVGKGFAVVATEVRNLASQTVGATQAISSQLEALKASAQESVGAVVRIVEVIGTIDKTTASIAGAVDEQGVVTEDTAREAQKAADQSTLVTEAIAEVSRSALETERVAKALEGVLAQMQGDFRSLDREVETFVKNL